MDSPLEQCSIGEKTGQQCHKIKFTKKVRLINFNELDEEEKTLVRLRSAVSETDLSTVCEHHKHFFLKEYESTQHSCCDPFKWHKKKVTLSVRKVSLEVCEKINNLSGIEQKCKPGQKICDRCRKKVDSIIADSQNQEQNQSQSENLDTSSTSVDVQFEREEALGRVNATCEAQGLSPFKRHGVAPHSQVSKAKKKITAVRVSLEKDLSTIVDQDISQSNVEPVPKEVQQMCDDFQELIRMMKIKLESPISRREKIQLLTLAPKSWSREKVAREFEVSEYAVRAARELLQEEGLLALPAPRKGKSINDDVIRLVTEFYENDEYSRMMPGQKDKVSIKKNEYAQKRLILCNLSELYAKFKFDHPDIKIGISKFCSLRPKYCVLAGSSGSHSVCVCSIHENVRLLLHAAALGDYHDFFDNVVVCSSLNRDCMLGHCSECPGKDNAEKKILEKFEEWDPNDEITYSAWVQTDRTQQIQQTVTMSEYLETVLENLEKLTPHSYITKAQSKFLKEQKMSLRPNEALVLMDFSQNFTFVVQDEVQGAYWSRGGCSLHPVVIYTKTDENAAKYSTSCLCMISDDLEHDVSFVYETQRIAVAFLSENFPEVRTIHYWTDGCAMQYKNLKTFKNLCCHDADFGFKAFWHFFATSHGKSTCDGIGGAVKRSVTAASLQRDAGDAINTAEKVFKFCVEHKNDINFYLLPKEKISVTRQELESRFAEAKTITGTRSFHYFEPLSETSIGTKRMSADEKFTLVFNYTAENPTLVKMSQVIVNSYVACEYFGQWYVGVVLTKDEEENDVEVSFLKPHGPSPSFSWPQRRDVCYVPVNNIISCISPPTTMGTGRMFYFKKREMDLVAQRFSEWF